jgi:hypothetical protein
MRTLTLILMLSLAGVASAQITTPSEVKEPPLSMYLNPAQGLNDIWNGQEDYSWRKVATVGDILAAHLVPAKYITWDDDSTNMVLTYYGKPFLVDRADSLIGIAIAGYDSATVQAYWRPITQAGNIVSAGPWAAYGAAATFTNSTLIGSPAHDSLITVAGVIDWKTQWSQIVQFKYVVTSTKTLLAAKTKKTMSAPGRNQEPQELWRGQTLPRFKRGEP